MHVAAAALFGYTSNCTQFYPRKSSWITNKNIHNRPTLHILEWSICKGWRCSMVNKTILASLSVLPLPQMGCMWHYYHINKEQQHFGRLEAGLSLRSQWNHPCIIILLQFWIKDFPSILHLEAGVIYLPLAGIMISYLHWVLCLLLLLLQVAYQLLMLLMCTGLPATSYS